MHLRQVKTKNGRVYLSIVQGYRTKDGKSRAKTVESLGYLDELEKSHPDPIAHFRRECERRNAERDEGRRPIEVSFPPDQKIDKRACPRIELGEAVPSSYFYRDLGLGDFFERRRTARKGAFDPCRILELLVWDRIAHPGSKKSAWEARGSFPRKCELSLDDVYRSLTYIAERADEMVDSMNASLEEVRGPRDRSRLYYDVTNYYFEVEDEDGLRRRGVSKENRPSPIVQMGLLLDGSGIPLGFDLFPGNTPDMTTMLPMMRKAHLRPAGDVDDPERERVVVVADKGLNTSDNIAAATLDGNGFLFSQSVRRASRELKEWVASQEGYRETASGSFKVKSRISDKALYVKGADGKRHRVTVPVKQVAFWSRDFCERARAERAKVIEKSMRAIERGDASGFVARSAVRYAKDVPFVRETGERAEHGWVLDTAKIEADAQMDGYYCLITSEQEWDEAEIIEAYRGLWRIEESFRVLKSDLGARPVYVSREDHIKAHFLVCYIALLIMRLMQSDTGWKHSASAIAEALSNVVGHNLDSNVWYFDYRTDLTDELGAAVEVDLTRRVLTKAQIRSIMADVKKPRT